MVFIMKKTVFITGGATGIGREIALLFYRKEYNVAIYDINTAPIVEYTNNWNKDNFLIIEGTTTDYTALEMAVKTNN